MGKLFRIFKYFVFSILTLLVVLYTALYILLSIPSIQQRTKNIAENELKKLLKTEISIEKLNIQPFNRVVIQGLNVSDQRGDTLLYANKLAVGVEIIPLFSQRLVFTTIQFFGFDIKLNQQTTGSTPNFKFIIDAFASKDTLKTEKKFDLRFNSVLIRRGRIQYDILSAPEKEEGFDPNHIQIKNFMTTFNIKSLTPDSINTIIKRLSFDEKSGFALTKLSFGIVGNKNKVSLEKFVLALPYSRVVLDSVFVDYSHVDSISQFADSTSFNLNINKSHITPIDIACFVPALKHFSSPINFNIQSNGTLNNLSVSNFNLEYEKEMAFNGDIKLNDITKPEQAYIFGRVKDLLITSKGINGIANNFTAESIKLPSMIDRLGTIRFQGELTGFFSNLVTYGKLQTDLGVIDSDIMIGNDIENNLFTYSGHLKTKKFKLNKLLNPDNPLGDISFQLNLNTRQQRGFSPRGNIKGKISDFSFKGYSYKNIDFNGNFNGLSYDGSFELADPNGHVQMTGKIDMAASRPVFDFKAKLDKIRLADLKLINKYPGSDLSLSVHANFNGNKIDNAEGFIHIDSINFNNQKQNLFIPQIKIEASNNADLQFVKLSSNIINGQLKGKYSFKTMFKSIEHTLSKILPSIIPATEFKSENNNNFDFLLKIDNTTDVSAILQLPVTIPHEAILQVFYDDQVNRYRIEADLPEIKINKSTFKNVFVLAENPDNKADLTIRGKNINKKKHTMLFSVNASAFNDELECKLNWSNSGMSTYSGEFSTLTRFTREEEKAPLAINIDVNPSNVIFNDTIWNIKKASIVIDSGKVDILNFAIDHGSQYLRLNGTASKNSSDSIFLKLNDINLNYIFQTLNIDNVLFGGEATGTFLLTNLFKTPVLATECLHVNNFAYNHCVVGDLDLRSNWNNENQGILMQGTIKRPNIKPSKVDGYIFPTKDSLWLNFDATKLNIGFLQPFVQSVMQNIKGEATGNVTLYGKFTSLNVVGDAYVEKFGFGINYLNTYYTISDSIHLRKDLIYFNDITVYDENQNKAIAKGTLHHKGFKDLNYDIRIQATNFLGFNVTEAQNPVYWGRVFATGAATIIGDLTRTNIDVSMRSNKNSKFSFSLGQNNTALDYQFINFVNHDKIIKNSEIDEKEEVKPTQTSPNAMSLNINLQMEITPDATFDLIMDPNTGDMISGNGSGTIQLEYNNFSDIKMRGTYNVNKGKYFFNLQDVITKTFNIREGSSIMFRGNPMATEMNIDATYQTSANLQDLDESFAADKELSRTSVPVLTVLDVSGDLLRPDLKFRIELPTVSQDIERRVQAIINTEDMMNRQVIYLLVLGKFYTPGQLGQNRNNELASVASSTLSSQLNNILGQISSNWNIGTNIRSEKGDFSDVEVQLALSSQLLNNRLLFNGNFGYKDNQTTNNSFIGDFDLEYILNKSGSLRLKAYNHYNDRNYNIKSALTTQGVGILFKKDFYRFSDLFYYYLNRLNRTPANTPPIKIPEKPADAIIPDTVGNQRKP